MRPNRQVGTCLHVPTYGYVEAGKEGEWNNINFKVTSSVRLEALLVTHMSNTSQPSPRRRLPLYLAEHTEDE